MYSLLIANYNNGKYFNDCYQSVLLQNFENWEIIVVDDGSTDDSVNIIRSATANDHRVKLTVNRKNKGVAYTKHQCVLLASAPWCAFLDPDDALLPGALHTMNSFIVKKTDIVLFHSNLFFCDEQLNKLTIYKGASAVNSNDKAFFNLNGSVCPLAFFNKEAYIKTGGIDPYMLRAVDQDMYIKLAEQGPFFFIDTPTYLYRRNPTGISTNTNVSKAHYWHWYAAIQAARRRGVQLEEKFIQSFVSKKDYDHLNYVINKSRVFKISKFLSPILKLKSRLKYKFRN